jgi:superfamily II DNA or RNA helicase
MPLFSRDDIRRACSDQSFEKGRAYQREGRARLQDYDERGSIEGTVQGSRRAPYRVNVKIGRGRGRESKAPPVINGSCSCPVGYNCKHVAALMLQALEGPAATQVVSHEVLQWLAEIERAERPMMDDKGHRRARALLYVLGPGMDASGIPRLRLSFVTVGIRRDGTFADDVRVFQVTWSQASAPKYLDRADLSILQRLGSAAIREYGTDGRDAWTLRGEPGSELLRRAVATGRCHWKSAHGPALREGPARSGHLEWTLSGKGRQRPRLAVTQADHAGIMDPPWYIDLSARLCGPIDLAMPAETAALFLAAPELTPMEAAVVRARLSERLAPSGALSSRLPPPSDLAPPRRIVCTPTPKLVLEVQPLQSSDFWSGRRDADEAAVASLSFLYETLEFGAGDSDSGPRLMGNGELVDAERNRKHERAAEKRLAACGFRRLPTVYRWRTPAELKDRLTLAETHGDDGAERWFAFMSEQLPALMADGWRVDVADKFPFRVARPDDDGAIDVEIAEASGIDWFELRLGVSIEGVRTDIVPALLAMLRQFPAEKLDAVLEEGDDAGILRLPLADGRVLPLKQARVLPILRTLAALYAAPPEDGRILLRRSDAALAVDMEQRSGITWSGGEALRALGQRLKSGGSLRMVPVPASFAGVLRGYQESGLAWLQMLRDAGLGGVLADDMGLGKTVQILAYLAVEKAAGRLDRPALIVAPTSLMPNWKAEAAAFVPTLSVLVQHGPRRKETFDALAAHDVVLTTYPLLARDADVLARQSWHVVIADEAQFIKNAATAASKAVRRLDARHRLALTGTPLENHLSELWALFDFVLPGFLSDSKSFAKTWRVPIEKSADGFRQRALAGRVRPFLLRRTKTEVAPELPPKTEIAVPIALGEGQRHVYEAIRLAMHRKVRDALATKGLKRSRIEFLDALLKLRQVCCDPRLVKAAGAAKAESAKLERLMEMLPELIEEGRQILLFSQFTSMLALIEAELERAAIPFVQLTGETRDRAEPVARFQRGEVPLFLISLKAGGTGLNLTAADTVIHYDPWWNPAVEAQATDRAHRIGQDKPVFIHRLVALDTIEVKMEELKARKQALADGLFDPDIKATLDLGADDVEFLLGGDA